MHTELTRNVPGNPDWIGSFYETLSEHGVWNENEYRVLIRELQSLADKNKDKNDGHIVVSRLNTFAVLAKVKNGQAFEVSSRENCAFLRKNRLLRIVSPEKQKMRIRRISVDAENPCTGKVRAKNAYDEIFVGTEKLKFEKVPTEKTSAPSTILLDIEERRPVLGNGGGGLSGPAIRPIAVRAIYDCHAALPDLPIIGVGGVARAEHAIELLLAGASAVQVGTATFAEPTTPADVVRDLAAWCTKRRIPQTSQLTGGAHP